MKFRGLELPDDLKFLDDIGAVKQTLLIIQDKIDIEFNSFMEETREPLSKSGALIKRRMDTDPVSLEEMMGECLAWSYRVATLKNDANTFLIIYQILNYEPKGKDIPEAARKNIMNLRNLLQFQVFNYLELTLDRLDKKMICLQSSLKAEIAMIEKGIRND